jgi:hypothetical protein
LSDDETASIDRILDHLRAWKADTVGTSESLRALRHRVGEHARQLENPEAAGEYIDVFVHLFDRVAADFDRLLTELPQCVRRSHLDTLRQIASNAAADRHRCLMFRDKWINRPLPYEQMRSLLSQIATETQDQLEDYRELSTAAARLEAFAGAETRRSRDAGRALDRRALFTRWFGH